MHEPALTPTLARLYWCAARQIMAQARAGRPATETWPGWWLIGTRRDPRCPAPLARAIDRTLAAAEALTSDRPTEPCHA